MANILAHLEGGIGNVIAATPALASLAKSGHVVDLFIRGDFGGTVDLFRGWPAMHSVSSNPHDFQDRSYDIYLAGWLVAEPVQFKNFKDALILQASYTQVHQNRFSEAESYLYLARAIDAQLKVVEESYCGHSGREFPKITSKTVILFPGCKKEYAMKRWDKFDELADRFEDVAVVGTSGDLDLTFSYYYPQWVVKAFGRYLGYPGMIKSVADKLGRPYNRPQKFPPHVKNFIGSLNLADTAALISRAGCFIGNDGGLSHVAGALGVPTFFIFGPSSVHKTFIPRSNIMIIKKNLDCQPCQYGGKYSRAWQYKRIGCPIGVQCLADLSVEDVYRTVTRRVPGVAL